MAEQLFNDNYIDNLVNEKLDDILSSIKTDEVTTLEQLYELQTKNAPSNVFLPFAHNIYDINLNTRTINGPEFISVSRDHRSEVIYFKIDRYYDYMDLANTVCIIEYIIPGDDSKVPYIYVVPFYDTVKYIQENKMVFPWNVGGPATKNSGKIKYAIRFYKVDGYGKDAKLIYSLSTLPTESNVLANIEVNTEIMKAEYDVPVEQFEYLIQQATDNRTYWTIL